jgi:hypothetical protein
MKRITLLLCLAIMAAFPAVAAQLYRWVDDKGNVEWRDTPPPPTAKNVESRTIRSGPAPTSATPYSVQQAVKNFPVTLWITDCGEPCSKGRAHLARRGVPYTEKNAQADLAGFKTASGGGMEVPLLVVGSSLLKGYLESAWDAALDNAGYPRSPSVGYKPPPPAAAPPSPAAQAPASPQPAPPPAQ